MARKLFDQQLILIKKIFMEKEKPRIPEGQDKKDPRTLEAEVAAKAAAEAASSEYDNAYWNTYWNTYWKVMNQPEGE